MGETSKQKASKSFPSKVKAWFTGFRGEFGKIVWPNRKTLTKESVAVLVVSVVLGVIIAVIDFAARAGIEFLIK
jgi:preprotein translocase subunit SecE